jgi:uncharacterized membrane protein
MRRHRDLELVAGAAIACAVLALAIPLELLSLLFLLPLALLLPGYAIAAASLRHWQPEPPQRLAVSLGLSLATLALGSLLLNYLGGLRPLPWVLLMLVVTLGGCRFAAISRRPLERRQRRRLRRPRSLALVPTLMVTVGLLAAAGSVALAFHPVGAGHVVGYSELWLRGGESPEAVAIGIGNEEHEATRYGLIVKFGGAARTQVRRLDLDPGERVLVPVPVEARRRAGPIPVEAVLYRERFPNQPYREVSGWVPSRTAGE